MVNTDVNEATEVNNVSYGTLKLHIRLKIVDVENVGGKDRCGSIVTNIAAGLLKLGDNILKSRLTATKLASKLCNTVLLCLEAKESKVVILYVLGREAEALKKILCDSIGLGVHTGRIEHLLTVVDTKEACALSEGLVTKLRNLKDLRTGLELAMLFSILNDILCNSCINARNVGKERVGCGVNVNTNTVYTTLNNTAESLGKSCLLHIMLILTNTDSLGLDLNKLCKGILNSSCDRNSRSLHYVKVGEFLGSNLRSRVNRSTCLGNDSILYSLGAACVTDNVLCNKCLALTGCGTVTDRDNINVVLLDKTKNGLLGSLNVLSGLYGINNRGIKHLTGLINYCKLTAVSITGVVAKNGLALKGSCKKKVTKVLREHLKCTLAGIVKECSTNLSFDCGEQKSVICVTNGRHKVRKCGRLLIGDNLGHNLCNTVLLGKGNRNLKELLLLTTVDGKDSVTLKLLDRLGEVIVVLINAGFLGSALG